MERILFLQPDGMADEPQADLGNKTPVQAAVTPNLDELAKIGYLGLVHTIPEGFPPGSDIGNLVLLGHDPHKVFTGRAPLEAAAQNIQTTAKDVVYRVNLVSIRDATMEDFTAGHISDAEAERLVTSLNEGLAIEGLRLYPGVSYRNLAVWAGGPVPTEASPPHDLTGRSVAGFEARPEAIRAVMAKARTILSEHPVNQARRARGATTATDIWFWGEGRTPVLTSLQDTLGLTGVMITAVDLLRGIAMLSGLDVVDVPGATGFVDTNFLGKAEAAAAALDSHDMAFLHLEAPDETAHMGRTDLKVESISRFDADIVGPLVAKARQRGDVTIICLPDHPTLLRTRTHSAEAVPCLVVTSAQLRDKVERRRHGYQEDIADADFELLNGWELLPRVWRRELI